MTEEKFRVAGHSYSIAKDGADWSLHANGCKIGTSATRNGARDLLLNYIVSDMFARQRRSRELADAYDRVVLKLDHIDIFTLAQFKVS